MGDGRNSHLGVSYSKLGLQRLFRLELALFCSGNAVGPTSYHVSSITM